MSSHYKYVYVQVGYKTVVFHESQFTKKYLIILFYTKCSKVRYLINRKNLPLPLTVVVSSLFVVKLSDASGFNLHRTVGMLYTGPWLPMTGAGSADMEIAFSATKYWISFVNDSICFPSS